jgi:hypothetical protein
MKTRIRKHPLLSFFFAAYAIAYVSGFGYIFLNPGQPMPPWSPAWFLFAFSPSISALLIAWIIGGPAEMKRLLSGFTRWKVGIFGTWLPSSCSPGHS